MLSIRTRTCFARLFTTLAVVSVIGSLSTAQHGVTFSTDYKGPSQGAQAQTGPLIHESDMLSGPFNGAPGTGQVPPPNNVIQGDSLGLSQYLNCQPIQGVPCKIEVDGFSRGRDAILREDEDQLGNIFFSVDEFARGIPGPIVPSVFSEAPVGDASADVFAYIGPLPGPVPPLPPGAGGNIGVIDGNGHTSQSGFAYPGLGLFEPNDDNPGSFNSGDNLDALDIYESNAPAPPSPSDPVYFSLDGDIFDPAEGISGSDSAAANSTPQLTYSPADILVTTVAGSPPAVYALASQLGLDFITDDVDAIAIADNGDGIYQPSSFPYDWVDGGTDMVLFSVRRGSSIIGELDSIQGLPIQPGDLLVPPVSGGGHLLMAGPSTPGIIVAAEAMGLRADRESSHESDDLDGVDVGDDPFLDCNNNGIEDSVDIANDTSTDLNDNGIPDDCEEFVKFCEGDGSGTASPCGNDNDFSLESAGCSNSACSGGAALRASGSLDVTVPDLQLSAEGLVPNQPGLYFQGNNPVNGGAGVMFGDGLRCVGGSVIRLQVRTADSSGRSHTTVNIISKGVISPSDTKYFQLWYRDPTTSTGGSPCGSGFNLSNGLGVYFLP